jgi:hypothetical protein
VTLNLPKYYEEMTALFEQAHAAFLKRGVGQRIFVISIWTDPDAAASAVCFETRSHSDKFTGVPGTVNDSPADFEYRDIAECEHASFPQLWEEHSSGVCWDELEPALEMAADIAAGIFRSLPLEENITLAINSRRDWFDKRWTLRRPS